MANNLTSNPWIIDTASATPVTLDQLRVDKIRSTGMTTAGHSAIVTDKNGKVKHDAFATGANYTDETDFDGDAANFDGLVVPTLGSGKVYVYLK